MTCPECDGLGVVFYTRTDRVDAGPWGASQEFDDVWDEDCPTCKQRTTAPGWHPTRPE